MHIDAFHRTAALPGVVHRAIGQRLGGGLHAGVFADIGRVFAAQLQLQPDQARSHGAGNAGARGMRAGKKKGVDSLFQQRGTDSTAACQRDKHISGNAGCVQQARNRQTGHGREFRRLVQHGIACQQGWNEYIAADKPRVVPGRDVGHHAQRHVLDLLCHAAFAEDGLRGCGAPDFRQKEVDAAEQAIEFIARHADRLAGFLRQGDGQRRQLRHDGCAKTCDAGLALGQLQRRPAGLGNPRQPGLDCYRCCIVGRQFRDQRAGGGVMDGELVHGAAGY